MGGNPGMICPRCHTKMAYQRFYATAKPGTQGGCDAWEGWSCYKCGEIVDKEVLKNRRESHAKIQREKVGRSKKAPVGGVS